MRRRTLALVLLLALLCPLTAGARAADLDPNGTPATSTDGIGEDPERAADLDPNGLRYDPPGFAAWLGSLVRAILAPLGI